MTAVLFQQPTEEIEAWLAERQRAGLVRSPGEAHEAKLPFYARHRVNEVVLVGPADRTIRWLALRDGTYHETDRSDVLDLRVAAVIEHIRWE